VWGIASFALAMVAALLVAGIIGVFVAIEVTRPGGVAGLKENGAEMIVVGLLGLLAGANLLSALITGVVSFFQKSTRRGFGIAGFVLSLVLTMGVVLLIIIGATTG